MFERVLITTLHVLVYYPELSMLRSGAIKCNLIQSNNLTLFIFAIILVTLINPEFNLFPYFKCLRIFNKKINREIRLNQGFVSRGH